MFLLSNAFLNFLQEYLTYIVLGVSAIVLVVIAIIIAITVKRSKKPLTYVSDDIDRTVDQAAKEKAALNAQAKTQDTEQTKSVATQKTSFSCTQEPVAPQAQESTETEQECNAAAEQAENKEPDKPQAQNAGEVTHPQEENDGEVTKPQAQANEEAIEPQDEQSDSDTPRLQEQALSEQDNLEEVFEQTDEKQQDGEAFSTQKSRPVSYRVVYDSETRTWEVRKDNAKRVIRRVHTKKEALQIAQELSQNQELNLVVHKKDGKFQKRR
ncbi:MAG: DUF2188 domain-containing protein [Clostridia bacterium]|nr:DUF2188 domain-containing protein [Clostridia bacterium]